MIGSNLLHSDWLQEQTIEREQERDEYQRELQKMRERLSEKEKKESTEYRLKREVSLSGVWDLVVVLEAK